MRIMRIVRVAVGAPMSNNHPNGNSAPEPYQTTPRKPTGYHMACHGVARQGEDGRPDLSDRSDRSDRSDTSAPPPRFRIPPPPSNCPHTPSATLRPSQTRQRHANPRGIPRRAHTPLIILIILINLMQASRPRAFAYRRRHQTARIPYR